MDYNLDNKKLFNLSKEFLQKHTDAKAMSLEDTELLREVLKYHEWRYYIKNDPIVSDFEYDHLYKLLEKIEELHPEWIVPSSPTQRVSNDLTSDFKTVRHLVPMLSLANSYNEADLVEFDQQVKRFLNIPDDEDIAYVVEPKFDGGSIGLVYEGDELVRGATRGNGIEGDDITNNTRAIRSIPLRASFSSKGVYKTELRGEVLIRKDNFLAINKKREKEGLSLFANARNTATGGLRMKDPREVAERGLEAFIYQLGFAADKAGNEIHDTFETHWESMEYLASLGFKIPKQESKLCKNILEAVAFCESWEQKRDAYPYELDGMVIKVNERQLQERAGSTAHHPRWAIAFKFKARQATSILRMVDYQVGRIGTITPVAKIDPVEIAGATISSVSLHNADFIAEKHLHIGDTVLVERAGDVIPYIVKAMDELRDGSEEPIQFPKECPVNDTDTPVTLVREEGEAAWRCPNCVCGQQDLQRLVFFVSKSAMDVDGMGSAYVERFYEKGWLRTFPDVFRLDYEKIAKLEGFGQKSAENLKGAIEKAKNNPMYRLLHGLSIHHLGEKVAQLLAARVDHLLDLAKWSIEDLIDIKDVGPTVAKNVKAYFDNPANIEMLKELEALGVNLKQTAADRPTVLTEEGPLSGKTILFTGALMQVSRKEAQKMAEAAGARNLSSVSSKLNILVVGEKPGSKLKKAEALGSVEVWTEAEFVAKVAKD